MTDQHKLAEARAMAATVDRLTRESRRVSPSAPAIIPITMIVVMLFTLISLLIKLFMNYMNRRHDKARKFGPSGASSPDIPTTPEDQTSMATTASMKTRGSLRVNPDRRKTKPPPVSLYQIKQKHSPGSASSKSKAHRAAMKSLSRAARTEPNRSRDRENNDNGSDDNGNNNGTSSPGNLSQQSDDTEKMQLSEEPSTAVFAAATTSPGNDVIDGALNNPSSTIYQPEVHIVQIRDLDDNVQHSQPTWSQTESDI